MYTYIYVDAGAYVHIYTHVIYYIDNSSAMQIIVLLAIS